MDESTTDPTMTKEDRANWIQFAVMTIFIPGPFLWLSEFVQRNDGYPRGMPFMVAGVIAMLAFVFTGAAVLMIVEPSFWTVLALWVPVNLLSTVVNPIFWVAVRDAIAQHRRGKRP